MSIKLACPNPRCRRGITANDGLAGRRVKCPACGGSIAVPERDGDDDDERPRSRSSRRDDDDERPRRRPARRDDDDDDRRPARGLLAAKGLNGLAVSLFFVGVTALIMIAVSTFLPWVSMSAFGMSVSASGLSGVVGWLLLILSMLLAIFALVALFALGAGLFKLSLWSAGGWGVAAAVVALLNILNGPAMGSVETGSPKIKIEGSPKMKVDGFGDMPDLGDLPKMGGKMPKMPNDVAAKGGADLSKLGDMGPKIGIGLWLAFAFALVAALDFGFLAVRSLLQPAEKRRYEDDDD